MSTPDRGKPASGQSALVNWIVTLTVNVVLPFATYVLMTRVLGTGEVTALLVSGIWPVLEIGYTMVKQRVVDEFSVFVLVGIVIGVLTTLFSDDARAVFLKDSITTGLIGVVMLVTLVVGRPLTFYLGRRFATDGSAVQRQWWNGWWQYPQFRRVQRNIGLMWGGDPARRGSDPRAPHPDPRHGTHGAGQQHRPARRHRGPGLRHHRHRTAGAGGRSPARPLHRPADLRARGGGRRGRGRLIRPCPAPRAAPNRSCSRSSAMHMTRSDVEPGVGIEPTTYRLLGCLHTANSASTCADADRNRASSG